MQPYTESFFQGQHLESWRSAEHVVPLVIDLVRPRTVIDFGCGVGAWLRSFREHGVEEIRGVDGDYVSRDLLMISGDCFVPHDLGKAAYAAGRTFDLAVSLETAEHLPPEAAVPFVKSLVAAAPLVLFSAAVPGQGGVSHVNEQWQDYWAGLFDREGYVPIDCVRPRVWENAEVMWWYAQNTFLYARRDCLDRYPLLREEAAATARIPVRLAHPSMYAGLRYYTDPKTMTLRAAWSTLRGKVMNTAARRLGLSRGVSAIPAARGVSGHAG